MKFRLYYQGPLHSSQGDYYAPATDPKGNHKHNVRMVFHDQLKRLWETHSGLKSITSSGMPLPTVLATKYQSCGINWVPLVNGMLSLHCHLDIVFLRRDRPGSIFKTRDLDNRLKTLFDALRRPIEMNQMQGVTIDRGNSPYYVLLENDDLISGVTVETDDLLDPPSEAGDDDSYVRVLITVTTRTHTVTFENIGLS